MTRRLTTKLLLSSLALTPLAAAPVTTATAQSVVRPNSEIVLSIGRGELVNVPGNMADVFVADDNVADVQVKSQRQLYVFGKAGGETTIYASNNAGDIVWSANVRVGSNIGSIDQLLALAMPEANISVATMGSNVILLTGTVAAPEDAEEAQRLVEAFVGTESNVISRLRMATPLQVMLQVKIAEVAKDVGHKIGTNFTSHDTGSTGGYVGGGLRDFAQYDSDTNSWNFTTPVDGSYSLGGVARIFGMDIAGALDLAESSGLASTLAQPNLTALSGETASFLAGGEYPYTVSNGLQGNSIEFKQYGVQLAFTPTVLADGRISLRVRPTVSSLDFSINANVPALRSRTAETTVELGSGQAFMIAGLLNNEASNSVNKIPGLGNLPILGSLFKSRQFQRNETELVIVVTPYLVKPMNASDVRLPTDGFRNADLGEGLFLQRGHSGTSGARRPMPSRAPGSPMPTPGPEASAASPPAVARKDGDAAPGFSF